MALTLSLLQPGRFKGIVAHSGILLEHERLHYQWDMVTRNSYYIAHGQMDSVVPVALARRANQRLVQAHAQVEYHEYPIDHTISEESFQDIHSWLSQQLKENQRD